MKSPKDRRIAELEMRMKWVRQIIEAECRRGYGTDALYRALVHIEEAHVGPSSRLVVS